MIDINKAEKYFKNNGYDDIIEESKPFCAHYTSMNVWGYENFADFISDVSEKWNDFSQAEKEDFATKISSAEKLTHISKTKGRAYLLTEARRAIMQAAYIGKNSATIDLYDVPDNNVNWLFEQLKKDGFDVSYISDGPAARIVF